MTISSPFLIKKEREETVFMYISEKSIKKKYRKIMKPLEKRKTFLNLFDYKALVYAMRKDDTLQQLAQNCNSPEEYLEALKNNGYAKSRPYGALSRCINYDHWYLCREIADMGDYFKTEFSKGGVWIGHESFMIHIASGLRHQVSRIAIFDKETDFNAEMFYPQNYVIAGRKINIYDVRDQKKKEILRTLSGEYAVYIYSDIIIFKRVSSSCNSSLLLHKRNEYVEIDEDINEGKICD